MKLGELKFFSIVLNVYFAWSLMVIDVSRMFDQCSLFKFR